MKRTLKAIDSKSVAFFYGEADALRKAERLVYYNFVAQQQLVYSNFVTAVSEIIADSFLGRRSPRGQKV